MKSNLSTICDYRKGKVDVATLTHLSYISTENMLPNKGGITSAASLPTISQTQEYRKGDVLVSNIRPYFKKIWKAKTDGGCSNDVLVFAAKDGTDPDFLYYVLADDSFFEYSMATSKGTKMPRGDKTSIMRYQVPAIDISTQRRIASILRSLDDKIELNTAINNNLQEQARALYRSWFVDFEPFDGSKPSNWKNGRLKDVLSLQRSSIKAGENTSLPYLPIDIIPMNTFGLSDVKPNEEAQSSLITFSKDDIVIGAMRVYFHRVIIAPFDGITRTTCFTLRPFNADYLGFSLLCCDQDSSIEYAQQTSKGSTMPYAVWDGGLGDMEIPIPDPKTAHRFNEIVMPMIRIIQSSFAENKNLRELRDSLLPRLMSGELDVSDLDL